MIFVTDNNSPGCFEELECCEICDQKFQTRKDLQIHAVTHQKQPCVVLERIPNLKPIRKEIKPEHSWVESEIKGNLKIKLKKSPKSEGFTVVSNNFDFVKNQFNVDNELAEVHENDAKSESEEEKTPEQSFENVMLNHEVISL